MDFKDQLKMLGNRVAKLLPQIATEEATKNALIMPFLQILGYDVFNPFEVLPEYVADIGIKKGEKVDYAILKDDVPVILWECKHHLENLDPHNSQLFRYFHTSKAKFGVLSNGIVYRFYTDLMEKNKMDEKPFFEFNIMDIKEVDVIELKKFHKAYFDIELIFNSASELKYSNEIKAILSNEFRNPTEGFVKFFIGQVYEGKATSKIVSQFTEIVKRSANQLVSDMINERLKSALEKEAEKEKEEIAKAASEREEVPSDGIVTTQDEMEAYHIVKAILRSKVDGSRITFKDTKSYFGIVLDDSARKTVCRLYLNTAKKHIGLFDANKTETRHELASLDSIHNFAAALLATMEGYLGEKN